MPQTICLWTTRSSSTREHAYENSIAHKAIVKIERAHLIGSGCGERTGECRIVASLWKPERVKSMPQTSPSAFALRHICLDRAHPHLTSVHTDASQPDRAGSRRREGAKDCGNIAHRTQALLTGLEGVGR